MERGEEFRKRLERQEAMVKARPTEVSGAILFVPCMPVESCEHTWFAVSSRYLELHLLI
jgi:hypothetical protein